MPVSIVECSHNANSPGDCSKKFIPHGCKINALINIYPNHFSVVTFRPQFRSIMNQTTRIKLSPLMFLDFFICGAWYVTMGTYLDTVLHPTALQVRAAYSAMAIATIISPFFHGMTPSCLVSSPIHQ